MRNNHLVVCTDAGDVLQMAHSGELHSYIYNLDVGIDSILSCTKGIIIATENCWFWTFKLEPQESLGADDEELVLELQRGAIGFDED